MAKKEKATGIPFEELTQAEYERQKMQLSEYAVAMLRAGEVQGGMYLKFSDARTLVQDLSRCLPDALREEECWKHAWNELDDEAQKEVKKIRIRANKWLTESLFGEEEVERERKRKSKAKADAHSDQSKS